MTSKAYIEEQKALYSIKDSIAVFYAEHGPYGAAHFLKRLQTGMFGLMPDENAAKEINESLKKINY